MKSLAVFSNDRVFRYTLERIWDETKPSVCFIGLNPSTADETHDDPTIRRCISYAKEWGYGALIMINLFAYRSTDPKALRATENAVGPLNGIYIHDCCSRSKLVVAAWGAHGSLYGRDRMLLAKLFAEGFEPHYLELTKNEMPKHPLYLKKSLKPKSLKEYYLSKKHD